MDFCFGFVLVVTGLAYAAVFAVKLMAKVNSPV